MVYRAGRRFVDGRIWLPGLDAKRNAPALFLTAVTPFYGTYSSKSHAYRLGEKPRKFARSRRLTKRQLLQLDKSDQPANAMRQALRYQACLDAEPTRTRAEVALMFDVSRARVTQHLNLLKLPSRIVDYLADRTDPDVLSYFTERRLRPLTMEADKAEVLRWFSAAVSAIRERAAEDADASHTNSA